MGHRGRLVAVLRIGVVVALLASMVFLPGAVTIGQDGSAAPSAVPSATTTPATTTPAPGDAGSPVTATVAVLVTLLSGVDLDTGTYDATFYLGMRCDRPCDPDGWEVVNATSMASELVTDEPDGRWWRVTATLVFTPDLHRYPFDVQSLPIVIERVNEPSSEVRLVADGAQSAVDDEVRVSGWSLGAPAFGVDAHAYPSLGDTWDQATFAIPLHRDAIASLVKYFLALAIFVLLGVATLVLARNDYHIRVGGTALVGLTVFYLATSADIVSVGYFTLWDAAVVLAYLALFLVLLCGIRGAWLYGQGRYEGPEGAARSLRLRIRFIVLIGVVYVGGTLAIIATGVGG